MTGPVIDASVHPYWRHNQEIRDYLSEPFRSRGIASVERDYYQTPGTDFADELALTEGYPATDPAVVAEDLRREGVDRAVLLPLTRGLNPDRRLGTALCAATNQWLAERWLDDAVNPGDMFRGTIRVYPHDLTGAIREIRRWADHPKMVQVGVPMEASEPYGKPQFRELWKVAAECGLPVAVHLDGGVGVDFAPTPAGFPRTFAAFATLTPLNYTFHLANLFVEGVFEELPELTFVFADGGADFVTQMVWRYDTLWRGFRDVLPWTSVLGSEQLADHVRFCSSPLEGATDAGRRHEWWTKSGMSDLTLYASHYPHWSMDTPARLTADIPDDVRRVAVLRGNAAALYGLDIAASTASA